MISGDECYVCEELEAVLKWMAVPQTSNIQPFILAFILVNAAQRKHIKIHWAIVRPYEGLYQSFPNFEERVMDIQIMEGLSELLSIERWSYFQLHQGVDKTIPSEKLNALVFLQLSVYS